MQHSDEHEDLESYTLEQVQELDNICGTFKRLVLKTLNGEANEENIIS